MNFLCTLVSSILGGIAIALSGAAYLAFYGQSAVVASLLFSIGFITVAIFEFNLFTDRIGFLFTQGDVNKNLYKLLVGLFGNVIGAAVIGILLLPRFKSQAIAIFDTTSNANVGITFLSSIICGMLIFIGIHGYRRSNSGFTGCCILILASTVISACRFEYAIANVTYLTAALGSLAQYGSRVPDILVNIFLVALGNAIGAMIFAILYRFKNLENEENKKHRHKHRSHHHHSTNEQSSEKNA